MDKFIRAKVMMYFEVPPKDVYIAFVEPDILNKFWLSKSSGPLRIGQAVHWNFMVEGAEVDTTASIMNEGQKLAWEWSDKSHVTIDFEALDGGTAVTLTHDGFSQDSSERIDSALDSTEGFSFVLADLKTLLESGTSAGIVKAKAKLNASL